MALTLSQTEPVRSDVSTVDSNDSVSRAPSLLSCYSVSTLPEFVAAI